MSEQEKPPLTANTVSAGALDDLRDARQILEHRGIADRLTELIGAPISASLELLPDSAERLVYGAVEKSLEKALDMAVTTLAGADGEPARPRLKTHKLLAGLSGAAGGALGGVTVALELPVSTMLILRSVADIARSEGEDLSRIEARLACLEVFALDPGRENPVGDETELGYFAVRVAMARQIREASQYVLKHGLADKTAPPLVKLLTTIGQRFGVVVGEKLAAQAIPVIGAVGGALINTYFIDHYQNIARAHFTIRRLEREYGADAVRNAYQSLGT
ncbi:EcsC family protein [Pirellulales bacterium]|nr:EcsC family protein [Pirellulales bacterium]